MLLYFLNWNLAHGTWLFCIFRILFKLAYTTAISRTIGIGGAIFARQLNTSSIGAWAVIDWNARITLHQHKRKHAFKHKVMGDVLLASWGSLSKHLFTIVYRNWGIVLNVFFILDLIALCCFFSKKQHCI